MRKEDWEGSHLEEEFQTAADTVAVVVAAGTAEERIVGPQTFTA